jgi:hypothetical protein
MSRMISVFVNAHRLEVSADSTALDAVRAWNAEAAREVEEGARVVLDSRGLPIPADSRVYGGAIFRLISARGRDIASADEPVR